MIVTPSHPQSAHEPRIRIIAPLSGTYRAPLPPSPLSPPQPPQHALHPEFVIGYDHVRTAVKAGAVGVPHHHLNQHPGSWQIQAHEQRPFPPVQIPPQYLPGPANGRASASASASASEAGQVLEGQVSMSHRKTSSGSSLVATRKSRSSTGSRSSVPPTRPRSVAAKPTQLLLTPELSAGYIRVSIRQPKQYTTSTVLKHVTQLFFTLRPHPPSPIPPSPIPPSPLWKLL
jgi:hypothetical protein